MGWRIVKQPNGRFASYSEVVDNFTHLNMTEDEALQMCQDEYRLSETEAHRKVQDGINDWSPYALGMPNSIHHRWDEALYLIGSYHGEDEVKKIKAKIEKE